MSGVPVCFDAASARTGRCPECHAKILVPFDYCDGWADTIGTEWVRAGKRIIEAHTDVVHPERPVHWPRVTPVGSL